MCEGWLEVGEYLLRSVKRPSSTSRQTDWNGAVLRLDMAAEDGDGGRKPMSRGGEVAVLERTSGEGN